MIQAFVKITWFTCSTFISLLNCLGMDLRPFTVRGTATIQYKEPRRKCKPLHSSQKLSLEGPSLYTVWGSPVKAFTSPCTLRCRVCRQWTCASLPEYSFHDDENRRSEENTEDDPSKGLGGKPFEKKFTGKHTDEGGYQQDRRIPQ